ncbi:MAG: histidinol dehydrogenase [Ancylobacter novellus]|uniref:Histidinol dehydrogenase n=1 Tax=Ancylobacter novellus TaxID=921 RepID=A0A2W5M0C2_ANCNO|nr:MAG: histidinol dehydrogenase [Ancylobacter novellus]
MPLYIRDEAVAELAREVKRVTGARTVTEAVKVALERRLAGAPPEERPLSERIADVVARADRMGPSDHSFDMKQFMDELSAE